MIQGFRSNPKDPESHILFFDIEALIGENAIVFKNHTGQPWHNETSFEYPNDD